MTFGLYPRLSLDLGVHDLAHALAATVRRLEARREAEALEALWAPDALATLSVRSAFDLYLSVLALPSGSEVLMSAVTNPDMPRLVREHGLVPVPVDVEIATLFPTVEACERAASKRSRMLVVAQLFGGKNDLTQLARWARSRGIMVVEDCAQAFTCARDRGSVEADATFHSFGTIKTATALGGGLACVRNGALLSRMRATQAAWPEQPTARYRARLVRAAALLALQRPALYGTLASLVKLARHDFDRVVQSAVRGFPVPPGGTLRPMLERRPCGALLAVLRHRIATFSAARLERRASQGERVARALAEHARVLGAAQSERTHWLVAFESTDRPAAIRTGRAMGLDVAAGASSIAAVPRPPERPDLVQLEAERFMSAVCFVPAYPEIPAAALARVGDLARATRDRWRPTGAGRSRPFI